MAALVLSSVKKVLVVGPIWSKIDKLLLVEQLVGDYDQIIINGGLSISNVDVRNRIDQLLQTGKVSYNIDNQDLVLASRSYILDSEQLLIEKWIRNKPNVALITFPNGFDVSIVNGGMPTVKCRDELKDNLEASFISRNWHSGYTGGMGYVVSNHPLTQQAPKFHRYSVQMGNSDVPQSQVYALDIDQYGVRRTIVL